jgi:hypothetical protein
LSSQANGKICKQTAYLSSADSVIALVNIQRVKIDKSLLKDGATVYLSFDNELSIVYLNSSKEPLTYGPVKGSTRWKLYMHEGHNRGLRLPIDESIVSKLLVSININIHGDEYFRKSRKSNSEFTMGIYHSDSADLKELNTLYENDSKLFFVEDKRTHWLSVDFQDEAIYIPESGYLVVMIYVKKGGFVLRRFDKPKYPSYKAVGNRGWNDSKIEVLEWDFISAINLTLQ